MRRKPNYRVVDGAIGAEVIALSAFGGEAGDPIAAWVKVGDQVHLRIAAPQARAVWDQATERAFRDTVRDVAATHELDGRPGAVTVLFDPPQTTVDDASTPPGEPIARR